MFHVDVASAYVAMRRIPYKIINECHSKCFAAILVSDPVPVPAPSQSQSGCSRSRPCPTSSGASVLVSFVSFVSIVRIFGVNIK